jgi:hypothetical protein
MRFSRNSTEGTFKRSPQAVRSTIELHFKALMLNLNERLRTLLFPLPARTIRSCDL